ncbi:MAG: hypothetical protein K2H45_07470, partial [Acetatifactor sp.]|nr:hypothetical protein [Acetatifactor sp.]
MDRIYQKNDLVTVAIEDIGTEGEGIGRVDGFTLYVKDAVVGDGDLLVGGAGETELHLPLV